MVKNCRTFVSCPETEEIYTAVEQFMKIKLLHWINRVINIELACYSSGSYRENTKCFAPNEFDFILCPTNCKKMHNVTLCHWSTKINLAIDDLLSREDPLMPDDQRLKVQGKLLRMNRFSKLHFIWSGKCKEYKELHIFVDIAVCTDNLIAKNSRLSRVKYTFHSIHRQEWEIVDKLSEESKYTLQGYVLCKAVRISSIVRVNPKELDLIENIKIDDVITSFILKACLFQNIEEKRQINRAKSAWEVAVQVYERLKTAVSDLVLMCPYTGERPIDCRGCLVRRVCCKRRMLIKECTEQILKWLRNNEKDLLDASFD